MAEGSGFDLGALLGSLIGLVLLFLALVWLSPAVVQASATLLPALMLVWFILAILRAIVRKLLE